MTEKRKLAVVVHGNDDVTVFDERGVPVLCKDCRFSGWLTERDFNDSRSDTPSHCLHFSGGAEPTTGERIIFPGHMRGAVHSSWEKRFPPTSIKNGDGQCKDYVPAKRLPWWRRWFTSWRKMRL